MWTLWESPEASFAPRLSFRRNIFSFVVPISTKQDFHPRISWVILLSKALSVFVEMLPSSGNDLVGSNNVLLSSSSTPSFPWHSPWVREQWECQAFLESETVPFVWTRTDLSKQALVSLRLLHHVWVFEARSLAFFADSESINVRRMK